MYNAYRGRLSPREKKLVNYIVLSQICDFIRPLSVVIVT